MNKPLLIAICILTLLVSCKKNSTEAPVNTISVTIDGVNESFSVATLAQLTSPGPPYSNMVITGSNGKTAGSDIISFVISSNNTITKGTYVNTSNSDGNYTSITFIKDHSSLTNIYASVLDGTPPTSITITSISATNVQGTFTGQLVLTGGSAAKSLTGGKFNVQIK